MKMCCKKITVFFNIILSYAFPCCMEFCLCEVDTDQWFALCCEQAYEKKTTPKWRYDLGRRKNFEQVFGMDKKYWFIPAYSEEDVRRMPALQGLEYPSKPDFDSQ